MSDRKARKQERAREQREAAEQRAAELRAYRLAKTRERVRRDEIVKKALSQFESEEELFAKLSLNHRLRATILRRAPKLMYADRGALKTLSSCTWVREIEEWKPKGKSPASLFKSLVRHLLTKYPLPEFLCSVFFLEDDYHRNLGVNLFVRLGDGDSLARRVKTGDFPVPLTKRMCHVFMQSKANLGFVEAVRHAQVKVFGGDRRLADTISSTRQLNRIGQGPEEAFWSGVVQWVCGQGMLAPAQIAPIFDWVGHQHRENTGFSMKGRTGVSVLRSVEEWHGELARVKKINGHRYELSGFEPWFGEREVRLPSGAYHVEKHCVTEILTSSDLAAEGRALRHCVYSYSWLLLRGGISMWTYRIDGERVLTVEVDNRTRRVVQCRGRANRQPTLSEMAQVTRWMRLNNLVRAVHL